MNCLRWMSRLLSIPKMDIAIEQSHDHVVYSRNAKSTQKKAQVNIELSERNKERKPEVSKGKGRMARKIKWEAKESYLSVGADRRLRSSFMALCGSTRPCVSLEQLGVIGRM